jgi:hypothetical protein
MRIGCLRQYRKTEGQLIINDSRFQHAGFARRISEASFPRASGDGDLDIAIADNTSPSLGVDIMLGNGNGTFQAPVSYTTAADPRMVLIFSAQ